MADRRLPITVVTGFLGSGKTTLLANVLKDERFRHTAAIINEFGEAGLDHRLIRRVKESTRRLYLLQYARGSHRRAQGDPQRIRAR